MFSCRCLVALGLLTGSVLSGCAAAKQAIDAPKVDTPPPGRVPPEPAARRLATPLTPASCAEGYQPSTVFVRKGWLGAYAVVRAATAVWVDDDDPTTAEQARDGLCLQTSGIVGMPPNVKSTCHGDYWVISTDHDRYTDHTFVIVPLATEAVVLDVGLIGGGPCTAEQSSTFSSVEVELHQNVLHVVERGENTVWSYAAKPGQECERSHTDVADYTYDLKTGLACEAFRVE